MVEIDPNLILSIWTGSIVPIAGVILYYWLFRRFESSRSKNAEKKFAYSRFLRVVPKTVEALIDYQSLIKVKQPDPNDPKAATAFFTQVTSMESLLKSRRATDIIMSSLDSKQDVDEKKLTRETVLETTRAKLLLEMGHIVISRMDEVDKCVEDLEAFDLPDPVADTLDRVIRLYGERATKIYANMIGEALGVGTADDTASWIRDWNNALEELKNEITEDLRSM